MRIQAVLPALLLVFALILAGPVVQAATVDVNGHTYTLSESQAAELALNAAKQQEGAAQAKVAAVQTSTVDEVSKWASLGKDIGAGLSSTAREMGVAVNDFAGTPVGILATYLIVWKLVGADLAQYVASFLWFILALPTWFYTFRRTCILKGYRDTPAADGKGTVREYTYFKDGEVDGWRVGMLIMLVIIVAIGVLVAFA